MNQLDRGNVVRNWQSRPEIKSIPWKDLAHLNTFEIYKEVCISFPWLIAEILFLYHQLYLPAIFSSFFFFLTGLRQVHGGYHLTLGISKKATDFFLFLFSIIMLGAMHAVKFNHLRHHKHCMDDMDIEARSAKMTAIQALLFGPIFPFLLHKQALKQGNMIYKRWIVIELFFNILSISVAFFLWIKFQSIIWLSHCVLMVFGQCLTAFFAVWTVHHDCKGDIFARTQRGFLKNFISYDMFYHVEHHLFPNVPQCHLHELAKRLDGNVPSIKENQVF